MPQLRQSKGNRLIKMGFSSTNESKAKIKGATLLSLKVQLHRHDCLRDTAFSFQTRTRTHTHASFDERCFLSERIYLRYSDVQIQTQRRKSITPAPIALPYMCATCVRVSARRVCELMRVLYIKLFSHFISLGSHI